MYLEDKQNVPVVVKIAKHFGTTPLLEGFGVSRELNATTIATESGKPGNYSIMSSLMFGLYNIEGTGVMINSLAELLKARKEGKSIIAVTKDSVRAKMGIAPVEHDLKFIEQARDDWGKR